MPRVLISTLLIYDMISQSVHPLAYNQNLNAIRALHPLAKTQNPNAIAVLHHQLNRWHNALCPLFNMLVHPPALSSSALRAHKSWLSQSMTRTFITAPLGNTLILQSISGQPHKASLKAILARHHTVFASSPTDIGRISIASHYIRLQDNVPAYRAQTISSLSC